MPRVERIYGWDDGDVYYDLENDDTEYCITRTPRLLGLVAETIEKYHKEIDKNVVEGIRPSEEGRESDSGEMGETSTDPGEA